MINLSFVHSQFDKVFPKPIPNFEFVRQSDGSVVRRIVDNPYEGLSADSFTLDSQLSAGVPLEMSPRVNSGMISVIDENNSLSKKFVDSIN